MSSDEAMISLARLLMRAGLLLLLAAACTWLAARMGWFYSAAPWIPRLMWCGLALLVIGCQIFFRRTSGVRFLDQDPFHEN
jgi:hypothetical protein